MRFPAQGSRPRSIAGAFAALVLLLTSAGQAAAVGERPEPSWNAGGVSSIAQGSGATFVGGVFSHIGPVTGPGGAVSTANPVDVPRLPIIGDGGNAHAVAPDRAGGWFVAGDFERVDGLPRRHLFHILPNRELDPDFAPAIDGDAWSRIDNVEVSPDGATVYLFGRFESVNGVPRSGAAAVRAGDGTLTGWQPVGAGDGMPLPGGRRVLISGAGSLGIMTVDAVTGARDGWDPAGRAGANYRHLRVAPDGSIAYALATCSLPCERLGGSVEYVAAFDLHTGAALWETDVGAYAGNLEPSPDGSRLYVGGRAPLSFGTIGGVKRPGLAALRTSDGNVTEWNPAQTGDHARLWDVGPDGRVYVAGTFGGVPDNYALRPSDAGLTGWHALVPAITYGAAVSDDGAYIYFAATDGPVGGVRRPGLAALGADGTPTDWEPADDGWGSTSLALSPDGETLYAGRSLRGTTSGAVTAFAVDGGAVRWSTPLTAPADSDAYRLAVSPDGETVYVSGEFTAIGGQQRQRLAALDTGTGGVLPWQASIAPVTVRDLELSPSGDRVYVAGALMGGHDAAHGDGLLALDPQDGHLVPWDPRAPSRSVAAVEASPDGTTVYAGGEFGSGSGDEIGGVRRANLAALSASTGDATSWSPGVDGTVVDIALTPAGDTLYVSGHFAELGGAARMRLAAVRTADALATGFAPPFPPWFLGPGGPLFMSGDGRYLHAPQAGALTCPQGTGECPLGLGRFLIGAPAPPVDPEPSDPELEAPAQPDGLGSGSASPGVLEASGSSPEPAEHRASDRTPPTMRRLAVRVGGRGNAVNPRFDVDVSERSTVILRLARVRGRSSHRVTALRRTLGPGRNRLALRPGTRLRPGRYSVRLVAVDAAGNRSHPLRAAFRVAG